MTAHPLTVKKVIPYMRTCGYKGQGLVENYTYYDKEGPHQVGAVGFFGNAHNSSTACIAVIENDNASENDVLSYRSLGCPAVLACNSGSLQFWHYSGNHAVLKKKIKADKLDDFFKKQKDEFSPRRIYRAKTIGRVKKKDQLEFVDIGLMPAVEKQEGEYLSGLMRDVIKGLYDARNKPKMTNDMGKWLFQAAFWLIGARILKDKQVESFTRLKISNIESLIGKVQRHYGAADKLDISKTIQLKALNKVAENIVEPVYSLSHITNESLAYVYENTLVTKATRKALGTHATPSWLVNYIVWQLADWIENIPKDDRIILEPACGHAPFLNTGARLLSFLYEGSERKRHDYLKSHLIGIERDIFAQEIARLSLTLADIPNKNGWDIRNEDVYNANVLKESAKKATILLCNPPFENFKSEKDNYRNIETGNKAAEVLAQTLPYMPDNSVFGVILPQGFLHKKNLVNLRKYILDNFELRTVCNLPDNVFSKAGHPSTVLLGRKRKSKKNITYIRVPKFELDTFAEEYQAKQETVTKQELYKSENCSFRVAELKEIWRYCKTYDCLSKIADAGQGLVFKGKDLPPNSITISQYPFEGSVKGFCSYDRNIQITELPNEVYLNLASDVIRRPQWGTVKGQQQILINYVRTGSGPWRLKAWQDKEGHPVNSNFIVIRSLENSIWTLNSLWALVNSPFANAFSYCNSMEKHNTAGMIRLMPIPQATNCDILGLDKLVSEYFDLSKRQERFMSNDEDELKKQKRNHLLKIDAEVLRLYDLPPRMEKQLLDYFAGYQRKGVDFKFDRYYPENFGSYIPLRMFISEEFQKSTVENIEKWIEDNKSPQVIKALDNAVSAFEED